MTIKYLPRIKAGDPAWGSNFGERTKKISMYFKQEYQQLKHGIEKPVYFRELLTYNYLYKGPVLEWYMRVKVSLEKNYTSFINLVPADARVLDIGCGYGFLSYMLQFTGPERIITAIDYDEEKVAVANHCFSRGENTHFEHADVLSFDMQEYDCIILSDILHYLQPDDQTKVLENCFRHLATGGNIIIRDGNKELKKRHRGTRLSEFLSTKLIGFNKTAEAGLFFLDGNSIISFAKAHNLQYRVLDETKLTSNVVYVLSAAS